MGPHHFAVSLLTLIVALTTSQAAAVAQPPDFNPFGKSPSVRDDAIPGYVELSDGALLTGHLHITRDGRLKLYDQKAQRQREVPWKRITEITCEVEREWMEKAWRFVENAHDRKVFTGRTYPARVLVHTIRLTDGRKLRGPLSGIVYVQNPGKPTQRFLLHKRQKGKIGEKLASLIYVRKIGLGDDALKEGNRRAAKSKAEQGENKRN